MLLVAASSSQVLLRLISALAHVRCAHAAAATPAHPVAVQHQSERLWNGNSSFTGSAGPRSASAQSHAQLCTVLLLNRAACCAPPVRVFALTRARSGITAADGRHRGRTTSTMRTTSRTTCGCWTATTSTARSPHSTKRARTRAQSRCYACECTLVEGVVTRYVTRDHAPCGAAARDVWPLFASRRHRRSVPCDAQPTAGRTKLTFYIPYGVALALRLAPRPRTPRAARCHSARMPKGAAGEEL